MRPTMKDQVERALKSMAKFIPPDDEVCYWHVVIYHTGVTYRETGTSYFYGMRKDAFEFGRLLPGYNDSYMGVSASVASEGEVRAVRDRLAAQLEFLDAILL